MIKQSSSLFLASAILFASCAYQPKAQARQMTVAECFVESFVLSSALTLGMGGAVGLAALAAKGIEWVVKAQKRLTNDDLRKELLIIQDDYINCIDQFNKIQKQYNKALAVIDNAVELDQIITHHKQTTAYHHPFYHPIVNYMANLDEKMERLSYLEDNLNESINNILILRSEQRAHNPINITNTFVEGSMRTLRKRVKKYRKQLKQLRTAVVALEKYPTEYSVVR